MAEWTTKRTSRRASPGVSSDDAAKEFSRGRNLQRFASGLKIFGDKFWDNLLEKIISTKTYNIPGGFVRVKPGDIYVSRAPYEGVEVEESTEEAVYEQEDRAKGYRKPVEHKPKDNPYLGYGNACFGIDTALVSDEGSITVVYGYEEPIIEDSSQLLAAYGYEVIEVSDSGEALTCSGSSDAVVSDNGEVVSVVGIDSVIASDSTRINDFVANEYAIVSDEGNVPMVVGYDTAIVSDEGAVPVVVGSESVIVSDEGLFVSFSGVDYAVISDSAEIYGNAHGEDSAIASDSAVAYLNSAGEDTALVSDFCRISYALQAIGTDNILVSDSATVHPIAGSSSAIVSDAASAGLADQVLGVDNVIVSDLSSAVIKMIEVATRELIVASDSGVAFLRVAVVHGEESAVVSDQSFAYTMQIFKSVSEYLVASDSSFAYANPLFVGAEENAIVSTAGNAYVLGTASGTSEIIVEDLVEDLVASTPIVYTNLISNPNFTTNTAGWVSDTYATFTRETLSGMDGGYIKVNRPTNGAGPGYVGVYTTFNVETSGVHRVTLYRRHDPNGGSVTWKMYIGLFSGWFAGRSTGDFKYANAPWEVWTATFNLVAGLNCLYLSVTNTTGVSVNFDSIEVVRV